MTRLCLQNNKIQEIGPDIFVSLSALHTLDLKSNCIQQISDGTFSFLSNLKHLHISNNNISEINQDAFSNLDSLTLLNLSNNNLEMLHNQILKHLTQLTALFLSWNKLATFVILSRHKYFYQLDLAHNVLTTINKHTIMGPRGIYKNIGIIQMSFNRISSIQQHSFLNSKFIHELYLQNNCLRSIHDFTFEGLDHVSIINLSCNEISIISGFGNLSNLTRLDLSHNSLTEIHDLTFKYLYSLEHLFLARNNIVAISSSVFVLKMLDTLELQMNSIASLSWSVFYINISSSVKENMEDWIQLNLSYNVINKTTEHCWIKQGVEETWIQTDIKNKELWNKSKIGCPNSGMYYPKSDVIVIILRE